MNRLPKLYGTMVWFCWNSRTSSSNRFPNMFQYRWWFRNPKQPVEGKVVFPMYCTTGFNTIRGGGAWFLVFQGTDPWKHLRFWSSAGHHICWASVEAHLYLEKRPRTSNFQCPTRKSHRNLVEKYKCHKDDVNQFLHFDQKVVCFKVSLVWLQKKKRCPAVYSNQWKISFCNSQHLHMFKSSAGEFSRKPHGVSHLKRLLGLRPYQKKNCKVK